jgi:hypothetical protein
MRNTALAITAFLLQAPGVAESQDLAFSPASLPDGWTIERESVVPAADLPKFEARLGARVAAIGNQFLGVRGAHLQVNTIVAQSEDDAIRVERLLAGASGPAFVVRRGSSVIEFARMNFLAAQACRQALSLPGSPATTWQATFRAAGLRARETAGWVGALDSGHVWAEVHLEGEGWLPVDATRAWLGVSAAGRRRAGSLDNEARS